MTTSRFAFWAAWLFWANIVAIGVGVLVAFAGDSAVFAPHNAKTAEVFFRAAELPPDARALKAWLFGVLGGTIAGFHVIAAFVARIPFRRRERWAHVALTAGLLAWFAIDSGLSLAFGVAHNVYLVNVVALVGIGLPLVATSRSFAAAGAKGGTPQGPEMVPPIR